MPGLGCDWACAITGKATSAAVASRTCFMGVIFSFFPDHNACSTLAFALRRREPFHPHAGAVASPGRALTNRLLRFGRLALSVSPIDCDRDRSRSGFHDRIPPQKEEGERAAAHRPRTQT